jgi:putative colanic acid biosynthesis glycosyltransferase
MDTCFFSVITVCFNAISTIQKTIDSVQKQTFTNYEHIIIDGLSTDGTVDFLNTLSHLQIKILSEIDVGIYDAMNKAINLSKGKYLIFIGADDYLYNSDVLQNVFNILNNSNFQLLIGQVIYENGKIFDSKFSFKTLLHNTIHHQGAFYCRSLFANFRYDNKFKIVADYELNLLLSKLKKFKYVKFNEVVSICMDGGISRNSDELVFKETNLIRLRVLGKISYPLKFVFYLKTKLHNVFRYK